MARGYGWYPLFVGVLFIALGLAVAMAAGWGLQRAMLRRARLSAPRSLAARWAVALLPVALVALASLPALRSYQRNRELIAESERIAVQTGAIEWGDASLSANLAVLDIALGRLGELQKGGDEGPPAGMGWGMYRGAEAHALVLDAYAAQVSRGIASPCMEVLVARLEAKQAPNEYQAPHVYLDRREALKLYLMLGEPEHLEVEWAAPRLIKIFVEAAELKQRARPHLVFFLGQLKTGRVAPLQLRNQAIASARAQLLGESEQQRLYALLIESLGAVPIDEWASPSADNAVFPPITLSTLFSDSPDARLVLKSRAELAGHGEGRVPGIFTARGRFAVRKQLENAQAILEAERWVEPARAVDVDTLLGDLRGAIVRYDEIYSVAWTDFFQDIRASSPASTADALAQLKTLTTKPYPYAMLLAALRDNVQAPPDDPFEQDRPVLREAVGRLEAKWGGYPAPVASAPVPQLVPRSRFVSAAGNGVVDFAFPPAGRAPESSLDRYVGVLLALQTKLTQAKERGAKLSDLADDFEAARRETWELIAAHDARTRQLMAAMLLAPLGEDVHPSAPVKGSAIPWAAP